MDAETIALLAGLGLAGYIGYSYFSSAPIPPGSTSGSVVQSIAQAINIAEQSGTVNPQTNNPLNLKLGDVGNGTVNGITVFPDAAAGWDAGYNQVSLMLNGQSKYYSPNMTIAQIGQTWTTTQPATWAKNVSTALGVTPDTTLADAAAAQG